MTRGTASRGVVVAYDCGTTSVKAAVIDLAGRVLGTAVREYSVLRPRPAWVEQDPEALWRGMCAAGRAALETAGPAAHNVVACVPVAPWKAIIPLGPEGRPLRPAITWLDDRAHDTKAKLSELLGGSGGPWSSYTAALSGADYWSKLGWLTRNEPDVWARATHIVGMATYLKWRATGVLATESSDDFLHAPNGQVAPYYAEVLEFLGISDEDPRFPPTLPTTEIVGTVTEGASADLGLPAGTPVLNGFGDLPAITLGTGRTRDGGTHMYIGSSSWLAHVGPSGAFSEAPFEFTIDRTRTCIAVGSMSSAGLALNWILEQTYRREREELGSLFWNFLDAEVDATGDEMGGLVGSHWFNGEPYPIGSDVRAVFLGLSGDHDRRHLVRAVLESVCMTHRMSMDRLSAAGRSPDEPLRVVGGGAASEAWMQIMADVLGHEVEVPHAPRYVGVMGAFYCALVGLGICADYDTAAAQFAQPGRVFSPRAESQQRYADAFGVYTRLPDLLRSLPSVAPKGAAARAGKKSP